MSKSKIINEFGKPVDADDQSRQIWYAIRCGYWTDDWSLLKQIDNGRVGQQSICPTCGDIGCQTSAKNWDNSVMSLDNLDPGYAAFLINNKSKCMKPEGGLRKAFEAYKKHCQIAAVPDNPQTPEAFANEMAQYLFSPHHAADFKRKILERLRSERTIALKKAVKTANHYGQESDRLAKEYACETADEIAARISKLIDQPE